MESNCKKNPQILSRFYHFFNSSNPFFKFISIKRFFFRTTLTNTSSRSGLRDLVEVLFSSLTSEWESCHYFNQQTDALCPQACRITQSWSVSSSAWRRTRRCWRASWTRRVAGWRTRSDNCRCWTPGSVSATDRSCVCRRTTTARTRGFLL